MTITRRQHPSGYASFAPLPRRRFAPSPGRLLGALLRWTLLAALGGLVYLYVTSPTMRDLAKTAVTGGLSPAVSFPGQRSVTLLLLGRDRDLDNRRRVMNTPGRSDLIMLVRADFEYRTLTMLSIPRDTRTRIPGRAGYHKINAAHSYGGARLAMRTVGSLLGVQPEHAVVVDFTGFEKAIDAMGGVELTVDRNMDYDDNWGDLHIHLKKGRQRLNGKQALGFVRFRHSDRGRSDSDLVRVGRQQALVKALREQVKHPLTLVRLPYAADAVRPRMRSSLKFSQLLCLAAFAGTIPRSNVRTVSLPYRSGTMFVHPDRSRVGALVRELF
jgi:LCP family protein required for cell wall assembly